VVRSSETVTLQIQVGAEVRDVEGGVTLPRLVQVDDADVIVHEHVSGVRRLGRRVRTTPLEGQDVADDQTPKADQRDATWRLLSTLPRQQRAVLVLRFYEDLPDRDIAAALGCSEPTVRSNASRALATLRTRLTQTEEVRP